ncbi:MAG TPA: VOC family protein [Cellvibrio sp.]|nr:VOC family protein [Cellvibrio sp.]
MAIKPIPEGYHSLTSYLNIKDAASAIEFYKRAFSAKEVGRITMPDNTIGHAELEIGDSKIMLAETNAQWGNKDPKELGGSPVCLCLYVADVDAVFAQALAAGATVSGDMTVKDQFYGDRSGSLTDPFGHQWTIMTRKENLSFAEMQARADKVFA